MISVIIFMTGLKVIVLIKSNVTSLMMQTLILVPFYIELHRGTPLDPYYFFYILIIIRVIFN